MSKCRAKNPGSCRVHGSTNAVAVLLNDTVAARNLQESTRALENADSMESYFEAQQSVSHDRKAYDATLKGTYELKTDLIVNIGTLTADQRFEYKNRLAEAKAYRAEVLSKDPAYQQGQVKYESFVKENGIATYTFSKENLHDNLEKLSTVPYGTPVAIKTQAGIIYTHAGDGYNDRPKNKLSKMLRNATFGKPSFVMHYDPEDQKARSATLSLQSSGTLLYIRQIQEVTVLKEDAYKNGFEQFTNPHASKEATKQAPHKENSRWAITGENYYYEIEGYHGVPERATWTPNEHEWHSGDAGFNLRTAPKEIREIKS
jgi:hypothetical protein